MRETNALQRLRHHRGRSLALPMMDRKVARAYAATAVLIAAVLLAPDLAHAQAAGATGANGGFIAPVINWFMTNFIGGLIEIGVLVGGVILMFMRLHLAGLATMIVGSLIVTNYQSLATLL